MLRLSGLGLLTSYIDFESFTDIRQFFLVFWCIFGLGGGSLEQLKVKIPFKGLKNEIWSSGYNSILQFQPPKVVGSPPYSQDLEYSWAASIPRVWRPSDIFFSCFDAFLVLGGRLGEAQNMKPVIEKGKWGGCFDFKLISRQGKLS